MLFALLFQPPPTVAELRPRTQAGTHTQADADVGADVKQAWRRLRERPTHRRQRTHALVRATAFTPAQKQYVNTLRHDGGGLTRRSPCWIGHRRPWRNCARARRHARTHSQTQTPAPTSNTRDGDCVRARPTDGSARRHANRRKTIRRHALLRWGGTHSLLAVLDWPPPMVAALRPRMQARTHTQADPDAATIN